MSSFECIRLSRFLPECGINGECTNGTVCVCDEGWEKSTEAAFYLTQAEFEATENGQDINLSNLICDVNLGVLKTCYAIALLATLVALGTQVRFLKSRRHVKKLSAYLICCIFSIFFCFERLRDFGRNVGEDRFITFLWSVVHVFGNVAAIQFNNKFISYQAKANRQIVRSSRFDSKKLMLAQTVLVCLDSLVGILLFSTSLVSSYSTRRKIFLSACGIYFFRGFHQIWAVHHFTGFVLQDMDSLLKLLGETGGDLEELRENMNKNRKGLITVYRAMIYYTFIMLLFYGFACFTKPGLAAYKYFIPIQILLGMLWSFIVLLVWKHQKRSSRKYYASGSALDSAAFHASLSLEDATSKGGVE